MIQGVHIDLKKIEKETDMFFERLSEEDLELFNVLVKMVKMYSELINEQNNLILIFYKLLNIMKPYVVTKEKNRRNDENHPKYREKLPDMEFVYKDIMLEMLNNIKSRDVFEDPFFISQPKNQQHLVNEYKLLKKTLYDKLEKRSKIGKEKMSDMDIETFSYGKGKNKNINSQSQFSW